MLYDSNEDRARLRRAVEKHLGAAAAAWAEQVLSLCEEVEADLTCAAATGAPRQKCEALESAKWRLSLIEDAVRQVPGFSLTGVEETHGRIKRLEQTFLALGLYRASGVVRA